MWDFEIFFYRENTMLNSIIFIYLKSAFLMLTWDIFFGDILNLISLVRQTEGLVGQIPTKKVKIKFTLDKLNFYFFFLVFRFFCRLDGHMWDVYIFLVSFFSFWAINGGLYDISQGDVFATTTLASSPFQKKKLFIFFFIRWCLFTK